MTRGEMNAGDWSASAQGRGTFQHWITINAIIGATWVALLALCAITSLFSGTNPGSPAADKIISKHAEAR